MHQIHERFRRVNVSEHVSRIVLITGGGSVEIPFVGSMDDAEDGWALIGDYVRSGYRLSYDGDAAILTAPGYELEAAR